MVCCQIIRNEKCGIMSDRENKIKLIEDRNAPGSLSSTGLQMEEA
jgi:hypothetical protein